MSSHPEPVLGERFIRAVDYVVELHRYQARKGTTIPLLEVGDARQAVAPPETEANRQLRGQQGKDHPPAGEDGDERTDADCGLEEARGASVDDVEVAVKGGGADDSGIGDNATLDLAARG